MSAASANSARSTAAEMICCFSSAHVPSGLYARVISSTWVNPRATTRSSCSSCSMNSRRTPARLATTDASRLSITRRLTVAPWSTTAG